MLIVISSKYVFINYEELITILVKKPSKKGKNYYFSIPIEFIRTGKIDPEKDYELQIFSLSQVKKKE